MKLSTVVVFGLVALAGSEVYSSRHYGTQNSQEDFAQGHVNERNTQYNGNQGLNQNQYQADQQVNQRVNYNQENSNERSLYNHNKQFNQGQNDEYSESNWNVQSASRNPNNNKQTNQAYGQAYNQEESQRRSQSNGFNQRNSEEYNQQQSNKKNQWSQNYGSSLDNFSGSSSSAESSSQEDYAKEQYESNDIANEIGQKVAQKMVKFYNIVEKYAARNGAVQTKQAQELVALRQWALPMANHHFLNMNDSKLYGLDQGTIKGIYVNTEKKCVDLEYFFNNMQVQGNIKASTGPKGTFHLKMANTNVNVSTELENHNRNYANSRNGKIEISYQNFQESADSQSMNEHIDSKYVQFINRAIESEMIDHSYNGLVRCLRSEIESTVDMSFNTNMDLVTVNKKSQLTVSLKNTKVFGHTSDNQAAVKQKKVQYVAFRENKSENGYKLKVKIVLAKQPSWESEVVAQRAQQHIKINNVKFEAEQIVAYAVMEHVQNNGESRFNVKDAKVQFEGLKYDIGKFNLANNDNEKLAREVGQNLQKTLEYSLTTALHKQLYQQQQICQQNIQECVRCNQYN